MCHTGDLNALFSLHYRLIAESKKTVRRCSGKCRAPYKNNFSTCYNEVTAGCNITLIMI